MKNEIKKEMFAMILIRLNPKYWGSREIRMMAKDRYNYLKGTL